jgi:hypothetical protein
VAATYKVDHYLCFFFFGQVWSYYLILFHYSLMCFIIVLYAPLKLVSLMCSIIVHALEIDGFFIFNYSPFPRNLINKDSLVIN